MSWNRRAIGAFATLCPAMCWAAVGEAVESQHCPTQVGRPLRYVDVFDGVPAENVILVPDVAGARSGKWNLAYVYDSGRSVTLKCKYEGGASTEVRLSRVSECRYTLSKQAVLDLRCR
ncbi:STY0301 family protein [Methylobacterium sp. J-068]|uniref:STY0301 family protein n=1 Tax=Methylobacterium sp. J-068 TaxID=2836649 RepID=UPI001FBAFCF9|nr:STY0301 family protein [Methylobacterium sp. J-068]MCJ2035695.1 hypothetical protein [Methylobacterium sp. J-068]